MYKWLNWYNLNSVKGNNRDQIKVCSDTVTSCNVRVCHWSLHLQLRQMSHCAICSQNAFVVCLVPFFYFMNGSLDVAAQWTYYWNWNMAKYNIQITEAEVDFFEKIGTMCDTNSIIMKCCSSAVQRWPGLQILFSVEKLFGTDLNKCHTVMSCLQWKRCKIDHSH